MERLVTAQGRSLAYHRSAGTGPGVIFLGGFRSDMTGTKAVFLEGWARDRGRAFLRFDYSGHGESGGRFEDGAIGDWAEDAAAMLALTDGPQVLVGSSMGGWIALLLARAMPDRVAGLVTVAAAPDFTDDLAAALTAAQRADLDRQGYFAEPSAYGEDYVFTRRLIEEGARQRIFGQPLHLPFPVRMLQGTADADVPQAVALRLLDHAAGPDIRLTLVKGADHRFSDPACLALIAAAVAEVADA
jgi:pimeloyl-ACP methyl ester carboxylesterase